MPPETWSRPGVRLAPSSTGWSRPEVWDDQPFILVDYLPLRRTILAGSIKTRLKELAAKPPTSAADRSELNKLAEEPEPNSAAILSYLRSSQLPEADRKEVAELAAKLSEEHKWLTPREIEDAKIDQAGNPSRSCNGWPCSMSRSGNLTTNPESAQKLTETESGPSMSGRRMMTYQGYSGREMRSAGHAPGAFPVRPAKSDRLSHRRDQESTRSRQTRATCRRFEFDVLKALDTYWNDIPRDQRKDPVTDAAFDEKFAALAPRKLRLGAPQGAAQGEARGPGRGRISRGRTQRPS